MSWADLGLPEAPEPSGNETPAPREPKLTATLDARPKPIRKKIAVATQNTGLRSW